VGNFLPKTNNPTPDAHRALQVRDIQFLRRRISVSENAVQLGVDHAVGPTKGRETRSVPVPTFVLDALSVQCAGKDAGDLVFGKDGYLPRPKSNGGWFAGAVKRAKVQPITPHDLRLTSASLAVSSGANVLALARMLGHRDPALTLKTYADLFDDDLDVVAENLHAKFSADSRVQSVSTAGQNGAQINL
jgi:integrase